MRNITVTMDVQTAIMLRDAARWFTEDQQMRRKNIPTYEGEPLMQEHARKMEELAKQFDQMRLDGADILDKAIKQE